MSILSEKTMDETSVRTPLMWPLVDFEGTGNGEGNAVGAGKVEVAMLLIVVFDERVGRCRCKILRRFQGILSNVYEVCGGLRIVSTFDRRLLSLMNQGMRLIERVMSSSASVSLDDLDDLKGRGVLVGQIRGTLKKQDIIEAPFSLSSTTQSKSSYIQHNNHITDMSANDSYELLCLENPLLDIQGEG